MWGNNNIIENKILALIEAELGMGATAHPTPWDSLEIKDLILSSPKEAFQKSQRKGYTLLLVYLFSKSTRFLSPETLDVLIEKTMGADNAHAEGNYIAAYLRQLKPITPTQKATLLNNSNFNVLLSCDSDTLFSYAFVMCNINKVSNVYTIFDDAQIDYILRNTDFEARNDFSMRTVDVYFEEVNEKNRLKEEHEHLLLSSTKWNISSTYLSLLWALKQDTTATYILFSYLEKYHPSIAQQLKKVNCKSDELLFEDIFSLLKRTPKRELFEYLIFNKKIDTEMLEYKLLHSTSLHTSEKSEQAKAELFYLLGVAKQKDALHLNVPNSNHLGHIYKNVSKI